MEVYKLSELRKRQSQKENKHKNLRDFILTYCERSSMRYFIFETTLLIGVIKNRHLQGLYVTEWFFFLLLKDVFINS